MLALLQVQSGLGGEEEAADGPLCESLLERRCGMGIGGLCDLLEGVIERRCPPLPPDASGGAAGGGGGGDGGDGGDGAAERRAAGAALAAIVLREALALATTRYDEEEPGPRREAMERQRALLRRVEGVGETAQVSD